MFVAITYATIYYFFSVIDNTKVYASGIGVHGHNDITFDNIISTFIPTLGEAGETTNYTLNEDITATTNITIEGTVNLCLAGCTLSMGSNYICVGSDSTLNIYDCSSPSMGSISGTYYAGVIEANGGNVRLFGGTISSTQSRAITVKLESNIYLSGAPTIISTESDIYLNGTGTIYANDGSVSDTVPYRGENISISKDSLYEEDIIVSGVIPENKDNFTLVGARQYYGLFYDEIAKNLIYSQLQIVFDFEYWSDYLPTGTTKTNVTSVIFSDSIPTGYYDSGAQLDGIAIYASNTKSTDIAFVTNKEIILKDAFQMFKGCTSLTTINLNWL